MKKVLLSLLIILVSMSYLFASGEPQDFVGIDKGDMGGWKNPRLSSSTVTCLIATVTAGGFENTDWSLKADLNNPCGVYISTSPNMITCKEILTNVDSVFLQTISTHTLITGTTVWIVGITRRPFTNVTADINFTIGTATTVVRGTCTIQGIDDTYGEVTEILQISTTTATGSKIWVYISTISWRCTNIGDNNGADTSLANAFCEVGSGILKSNKTVGNVGILYPGEPYSPTGMTRKRPVFGKVVEGGGTCIIYVSETKYNH